MKAMVLAAGLGTRLQPLTLTKPKPLVEVRGKPILEYNLQLLKEIGVTEVYMNAYYLADVLDDYLKHRKDDGLHITLIKENMILGSAGGTKQCERFFDETFIVISGDILTDISLFEFLKRHKDNHAIFSMALTKVFDPRSYGVVQLHKEQIVGFHEKPTTYNPHEHYWVNTGIYIAEPSIFPYIPDQTFFDFSKDLFPLFLQDQIPFYGFTFSSYWRDLGTIEQLTAAEKDIQKGVVFIENY